MNLNYKDYLQVKRESGVTYKTKKNIYPKDNGRSADYVMSAAVVGCELSCTYCYICRNREFGNPVEQYTNLDEILQATKEHFECLQQPKRLNQTGELYTYDIFEASDALSGSNIAITNKVISYFVEEIKEAKCTFATKLTNYKGLLPGNYKNTRLRVSLMPECTRTLVEYGTATIAQRLKAINHFYNLGYEVHLNFSPVILTETWVEDYINLFKLIDQSISKEVKEQLRCEVIFLTHHQRLHESNLTWNPKGEEIMWQPELQKVKPKNNRGSVDILNYKDEVRFLAINYFRDLIEKYLPYCFIRYIF